MGKDNRKICRICLRLIITTSLALILGCGEDANQAPVISSLNVPSMAKAGESIELQVIASDPDSDALIYEWIIGGEAIDSSRSNITWTIPHEGENVTVEVHVNDGINQPAIGTGTITIGIGSSRGEDWEVIVLKTDKRQVLHMVGMTTQIYRPSTFFVVRTRLQYISTRPLSRIDLGQFILKDSDAIEKGTSAGASYIPYAIAIDNQIFAGLSEKEFDYTINWVDDEFVMNVKVFLGRVEVNETLWLNKDNGFEEGDNIILELAYHLHESATKLYLEFPGNPPINLGI